MPEPKKSTTRKTSNKAAPKKANAAKATPRAKVPVATKRTKASGTAAKAAKKRVDFTLRAPEAEQVYLAGSFNDWDAGSKALKRGKDATWRTWTSLPAGTYEYRFIVDGEWMEDPTGADRQPNPYGSYNSVVKV